MRAIKFRYIWRRKGDGHIYVNIVPIECLEGAGDTPFVHMVKLNLWEMVARSQWTGLLDKNGVEIFEGDIVEYWGYGPNKDYWEVAPQSRHEVTLEDFRLWLKDESLDVELEGLIEPTDCLIIGTIHQNPELLQN